MQSASVDVVYILGAGRSGSTVLEQIVSGMPGYACIGEVCFLYDRGQRLDEACSCGQPFSQCEFWQRVIGGVFADEEEFRTFFAEQAYFMRLRRLPQHRFPFLRRAAYQERVAAFHRAQARLFEVLISESKLNVLVDSSKFSAYGYLLTSNPYLNVHVIHLIRDARGVAFSWQRIKQRPEANKVNLYMPVFTAGQAARIWIMDNILAAGLRRRLPRAKLLRYEDFCKDPALVRDTLSQFGFPLDFQCVDPGVDSTSGSMHSASGNPARLKAGPLVLMPDDEWRTTLTRRDRIVVTALAAPLLIKYGYLPRRKLTAA